MSEETNRAEEQAKAQLQSIVELVAKLNSQDQDECEAALEEIQNDPLSIEVRSGWNTPGAEMVAEEFCILLCTGGPAVKILGELDGHSQPDRAWLEYQDWGTPWTEYFPTAEEREALLTYCQQFYFGN